MSNDTYFEANRRTWDERVPVHARSEFSDVPGFLAGARPLPSHQIEEVGDVSGKTLLHLQCHFGLDTLNWARLGAKVVGLDFSGEAVREARRIAEQVDIDAEFVEANVYDAPEALGGRRFDVVYTGRGALVWLPDMVRWAEIVAALLAPGGMFYIDEHHPIGDIFDDEAEELRIRYPYFHAPEPDRWDGTGTYTDPAADTTERVTYEWTHTIGQIVTALAQAGLVIEFMHESDSLFWKRFPFMVAGEALGTWLLPEHRESVPLVYSLRARKPA